MYVFDGILLVSRHDVGKTIVSCKKDIKWRNQEGEHQHRSAINKKIRNKRGRERERHELYTIHETNKTCDCLDWS